MGFVVIHYSEIGIKKGNRDYFEKLLVRNVQKKLGGLAKSVKRRYGYLLVTTKKPGRVCEKLVKVPGVAYCLNCLRAKLDVKDFKKKALEILEGKDFESFRISAKRQNKDFPLTSVQVNEELGAFIVEELGKKVDLEEPDADLVVEVYGKHAYLSADRYDGVGGLPVDPKNKVLGLMSGGFDSPVAAYAMMKRGAKVVLVHFQNYRLMKESVKDKVEQLAGKLSEYQGETTLYLVPFDKIQQDIVSKCEASVRMLAYRRVMLHISEKILEKEKGKALVTGDNMSQVSSQTLENLRAVYDATNELILTPLIGFNKVEIIDLSKRIGTFQISKLPYGDCCTYFLPEHPELKATPEQLREEEEKLDEGLWDQAFENTVKKKF